MTGTEWKTSVHRAAPRRSRLPLLRRSRLVAVLGGAALFAVALLVGMAWFSPGAGSAQDPETAPTTLPTMSSSATPSP